jgi:hypothetical protein
MSVPAIEYERHTLMPMLDGDIWTVVIRPPNQIRCCTETAKSRHYDVAILEAKSIVAGLIAAAQKPDVADTTVGEVDIQSRHDDALEEPTVAEFGTTLELHRHVMAELDARAVAIAEKEADARKALEQALDQCAQHRAAIEQDKASLVQAEQLYRRFLTAKGSESQAASPSVVPMSRRAMRG